MERLNKVLARSGVASRRASDRLIEQGRVTVNGLVVTELGTKVDAQRDSIKVDGKRVASPPTSPMYLMLHKPRACVTTLSDPEGRPTIRDLLRGVRRRVFPVGRLDYHSEGLLLLTDDGELARDLMHPGRGVPKTYAVKVRRTPTREQLGHLERGIVIDGRRTLPARVRTVQSGPTAWIEVTIVEGRKHQVRNMLRAVGHPVLKLRRVGYAGLALGNLAPGEIRHLTQAEIARLQRAARGRKRVSTGTRRPRRSP